MKQKLVNCNNNKIDKPVVSPVKEEREKTEITNIRNEERGITTDFIEIKRIWEF